MASSGLSARLRPPSVLARGTLGVLAVAAVAMTARVGGGYVAGFAHWVQGLGVWGPVVFMVGYVVATVAVLPAFILTFAAGAIFGIALGVAYVFIGAVLGSALAFLIARYIARSAVERHLATHVRFAAIDRAVGAQGRRVVFLLRLSPIFPFTLVNYALGLTRVRFIDYLIASVGMLPVTALYVYCGKLAGEVAVLAGGVAVERSPAYYPVLAVGLLATALVTALLTRTAREALRGVADP
jgi:uncharacterized membrane protein YdjX (TVP38/TMEM64 family)